jgi:hypothetical protein
MRRSSGEAKRTEGAKQGESRTYFVKDDVFLRNPKDPEGQKMNEWHITAYLRLDRHLNLSRKDHPRNARQTKAITFLDS